MNLKTKLLTGFALCAALTLAFGLFALYAAKELNEHTRALASSQLPRLRTAKNLQLGVLKIGGLLQEQIAATDSERREAVDKRLAEARKFYDEQRAAYGAAASPDDTDRLAALDMLAGQMAEAAKSVASLANMGNTSAASTRYADRFMPARDRTLKALDELADGDDARVALAADRAQQRFRQLLATTIGVVAVIAVVAAAVAGWIMRDVQRQLGGDPSYASSVAREVASGNLGVEVAVPPGDDGSLLQTMRAMAASLAAMVADIKCAVDGIRNASAAQAEGNQRLSQRTEHTVEHLERTTASMQQLTGAVQQAGERTREAAELAQRATADAGTGAGLVDRLVATMEQISTSSRRIADITQVIDGIAFQTNILALNAAVEAARAGEQGRSFAVVASEVRALATRCSDAARDIKSLITSSGEEVAAGGELVDDAGASIRAVAASIARLATLVQEIDAATLSQTKDIQDVNAAVEQLSGLARQNIVLVETAAQSAASIEQQAERLNAGIGAFRVA